MNNQGKTQLRFILTTLRKHKWPILLLTLLITSLAAIVVWSLQPTYRATSSMLFELDGKGTIIKIDELVALEGSGTEYLQTQVEILRSKRIATLVTSELDLQNHWDLNDSVAKPPAFRDDGTVSRLIGVIAQIGSGIKSAIVGIISGAGNDSTNQAGNKALTDRIIEKVKNRIKVTPAKGSNVIRISYDSADPALAATVANTIGRLYLQTRAERRAQLTDEAAVWLQERQDEIKQKLDESEANLLKFRENNNLINYRGNVSGLNEQQISVLAQELLSAQREMQRTRLLADEIAAARSQGVSAMAKIPQIGGHPLVLNYLAEYQDSEADVDRLSNLYLERHPRMIDARLKAETLYENYLQQILRVAATLEQEYQVAQATVRNLENQISIDKTEIQLLGRKQVELSELERDVETNRDLYAKFYNRVRETDESRGLAISNATIADFASIPQTPVKPRKAIILGTIFLLSLLGLSASSFAFEDYKDTIQGTHDVENKLGMIVLGVIPFMKKMRRERLRGLGKTPTTVEDPNGLFLESIRTLRTSVKLHTGDTNNKILMITSSVPDEGKSTIAINLAIALARHERTLLIEADLRKPGIASALSLNGPGLVDVLSGKSKLSECISRRTLGGADVLSAGLISPESAEYLGEKSMATLINILVGYYDKIIIDTAPIEAVSDALTVGKLTDATIFVVKASSTTSVEAKRSLDRLKYYGQNVLGVVISQVDLDKVTKYGGDYFYHGFFDKYGYTSDEAVNDRMHKVA